MRKYLRLREIREDADLTQEEMANKLNIAQTQYSRYERGQNEPPVAFLKEFCKVTGVSADYILEIPKGLNWPR